MQIKVNENRVPLYYLKKCYYYCFYWKHLQMETTFQTEGDERAEGQKEAELASRLCNFRSHMGPHA